MSVSYCYVYYRVPAEYSTAIGVCVDAMLASARRQWCGQAYRLIRHGDPTQWLEVYEAVTDAGELQRLFAGNWPDNEPTKGIVRHEEWFERCGPDITRASTCGS